MDGWTAGTYRLRRVDGMIFGSAYLLNGSAATTNTALPMPTGFRPAYPTSGHLLMLPNPSGVPNAVAAPVAALWQNAVSAWTLPKGVTYFTAALVEFMYLTDDAHPATLPGVPA